MAKSADAFRTISEVADWLDTPAHVLRFWESKFTQIKPIKRGGGRRYYRPSDMLLLGGIKKLLHEDGMTIKGAQKVLREQGVKHVSSLSQPLDLLTEAEKEAFAALSAPAQTPKPEVAEVISFERSNMQPVPEVTAPDETSVNPPAADPEPTPEPVDERPVDADARPDLSEEDSVTTGTTPWEEATTETASDSPPEAPEPDAEPMTKDAEPQPDLASAFEEGADLAGADDLPEVEMSPDALAPEDPLSEAPVETLSDNAPDQTLPVGATSHPESPALTESISDPDLSFDRESVDLSDAATAVAPVDGVEADGVLADNVLADDAADYAMADPAPADSPVDQVGEPDDAAAQMDAPAPDSDDTPQKEPDQTPAQADADAAPGIVQPDLPEDPDDILMPPPGILARIYDLPSPAPRAIVNKLAPLRDRLETLLTDRQK